MGRRRRRRGQRNGGHSQHGDGTGGDSTAGPDPDACSPSALKVPQELRFADTAELFLLEESGCDEYTFDNYWDDGTPRVCHRRSDPRPYVSGPIPRSQVIAHKRAVQLFAGLPVPVPPPRAVVFDGRRPNYEEYPEVYYENDFDDEDPIDVDLSNVNYEFYTHKPLAIWVDGEVTTEDELGLVTTWDRTYGLWQLRETWQQYYHVGDVPPMRVAEDPVGASTDRTPAAPATSRRRGYVIEWIVDSGAGLHIISMPNHRRGGFRSVPYRTPLCLEGVGGNQTCTMQSIATFDDWPAKLYCCIQKSGYNLLSVDLLGSELNIDFINMASKGLPPYLVFPNDTAIVTPCEGNVPIYRSNDDRYLPEPITLEFGWPVPVSLVPRLFWATGVARSVAPAAGAPQRQDGSSGQAGGDSAAGSAQGPEPADGVDGGDIAARPPEVGENGAEARDGGASAADPAEAPPDAAGGGSRRFSLPAHPRVKRLIYVRRLLRRNIYFVISRSTSIVTLVAGVRWRRNAISRAHLNVSPRSGARSLRRTTW